MTGPQAERPKPEAPKRPPQSAGASIDNSKLRDLLARQEAARQSC